jgi:hypothetical protein
MLRRTFTGDPLPEPTFIGPERQPKVTKLWKLKRRDGVEVDCQHFYDSSLCEATLEVSVRSSHADDVFASELAEKLRALLVGEGARALEEAEA